MGVATSYRYFFVVASFQKLIIRFALTLKDLDYCSLLQRKELKTQKSCCLPIYNPYDYHSYHYICACVAVRSEPVRLTVSKQSFSQESEGIPMGVLVLDIRLKIIFRPDRFPCITVFLFQTDLLKTPMGHCSWLWDKN